MNSSNSSTIAEGTIESMTYNNSGIDFLIGLLITLGASLLNAFGLNLTKLDLTKESQRPRSERRADYLRPLWLLGLLSYVASQLVGSTLALAYLRAEYVGPLGASSLIFNVVFSYLLVHTRITKLDLIGTCVIIVSVIGVVAFGNQRSKEAADVENQLDLAMLKQLWAKPAWFVYFIGLELLTGLCWWVASIADEVLQEREELDSDFERPDEDRYGQGGARQEVKTGWIANAERARDRVRHLLKGRLTHWAERQPDATVKRVGGFLWSLVAGLLSSQTLIFAKSAVKLFSAQAKHQDGNQFSSPLSIFILLLLAFTAVAQIFCLNRGLRVADSTVVVPTMFAAYSGFGFVNSLIYLDQLNVYSKTITAMICLSLLLLVVGVGLLSSKKSETAPAKQADLEDGADQDAALGAVEDDSKGINTMEDVDDNISAFMERSRSKLVEAVSKIGARKAGTQLLGRGVDRQSEEAELQTMPTVSKSATLDPETVWSAESPFDDAYELDDRSDSKPFDRSASSTPTPGRRRSNDSLDSDFGRFVDAKK